MKLKLLLALALSLSVIFTSGCEYEGSAQAQTNNDTNGDTFEPRTLNSQYEAMELSRVAGPFEHPWSIAFLPDDRILVTERPGRLKIVENGDIIEIEGVPEVMARGQGGMLEVLPHHDFENNGWIYLTFSKSNGDDETATVLVRGKISDDYQFTEMEEIFEQNRYSSPGRHYGSKLAWHTDGTLLMSIGDRGADPPRAQDREDHAGTLLRLNDDGTVPDDNPFADGNDAAPEVYSYGHRNIQGLVVNPGNGEIWATEHGPRGGDELNKIEAGENYGWPTVTLGRDYRTEGPFPDAEARTMEGKADPIYEFLPTHAPSGLALVTSGQFSTWEGNLLAGGLRSERIRRLVIYDDEVIHDEELLLGEVGRIRDVREGPDGNIYVISDSNEGYLYRVAPTED